MATKTPQQVAQEFLTHLAGLKPDVDVSLTDSDWWVKAQALGGVAAGIYADQALLANDPFPQSARADAIAKHLKTYFTAPNDTFIPAQPAVGFVAVTGTIGTPITVGLQFLYQPNGNSYLATSGFTMAATSALVPVQSVGTGQVQNLLSGAALFVPSPPSGLSSNAAASGDLAQGRDQESIPQAAARVLSFIQEPPAGGTVADYVRFAQQADPSVVGVSVLRYSNGFGTVGLVITAGTSDIDQAIDNGEPVVVVPTADLIQKVQDYVETVCPLTDCVTVVGPSSLAVNVTAKVSFASGDGNTILPGQTLTQAQLVQREIQRALYKTPPGGRLLGGVGYVVASDIEAQVDSKLSDEPHATGTLPILLDRQITITGGSPNLPIASTQVPIPGTITVTWF